MLGSQACVLTLLSEGRETNVHSKIILLTDATGNGAGAALLVVTRMGSWDQLQSGARDICVSLFTASRHDLVPTLHTK